MNFTTPASKLVLLVMVVLVATVLLSPLTVWAVDPPPSGSPLEGLGNAPTGGLVTCTDYDRCNYDALLATIRKVIDWIIGIASLAAAGVIAYGGVMMTIGAKNPGEREKAKKILYTALWGLLVVLASYAIVKTIFDSLGVEEPYNPFNNTPTSEYVKIMS